MSLRDLFGSLQRPPSGSVSFTAEVVPGWPAYRVACDSDGRPALLVAPLEDATNRLRVPCELKYVSLLPAAPCSVTTSAGVINATLSIIRCKSDAPDLQRVFLDVLSSWIETVGQRPTTETLSRGFQKLTQLFEALAQPPTSDVKGLWGELLVIAASQDPGLLVRAWHCTPTELWDFHSGMQLVEVKTTSVLPRRHDVSVAQLTPPEGTSLVILSVAVEETDPRTSIWDLAESVKRRLPQATLRLRIDEVVASTLGHDWPRARHAGYSARRALTNLRAFASDSVPCVDRDLPPEISDVRFKVELDGIPELAYKELRERGGLHAAIATSADFLSR